MKIDVLELAKALAVLSAGAAVIFKIIKPVAQVLKQIDRLEQRQKETHMQMLRLIIVSEEMPLEERIKAGDEYERMGGNGAVRHLYRELLKRLPPTK